MTDVRPMDERDSLDEEWEAYRDSSMAADAPPELQRYMESCFMAGAAFAVRMMHRSPANLARLNTDVHLYADRRIEHLGRRRKW